MNVLVTGGTGFIGRRLVEKLVKNGAGVAVLTRDKNKTEAFAAGEVEIFEANISDKRSFENLKRIKTEVVIHLAACIDPEAGREALFRTNVDGTANVLELAGKLGATKFVHISSIEAIGPVTGEESPAGEAQSCRPVTFYGESKLKAEEQVLLTAARLKMAAAILRLGNVYGPGSPSFVLPIAKAALSSNKAWLYDNWELHRWHPVFIDDAVAGIMSAAAADGRGGIYIISGAEPASVGRLARVAARELGVDLEARPAGIRIRLSEAWARLKARLRSYRRFRTEWSFSIEKARRELGYEPQVSLEDGMRRTLEWAKKEGLLPK